MVKLIVCKIVNLKFRLNKVYEYSLKKQGVWYWISINGSKIKSRKLSVAYWWKCWEEAIKAWLRIPSKAFFNKDFLD